MSEEEAKKFGMDLVVLSFALMFFITTTAGLLLSIAKVQAETSVKMTSHSVAGMVTALSSAPQKASYCLSMPGGPRRNVTVRTLSALGVEAAGVIAASENGNFRTDMPVKSGFTHIDFIMPQSTTMVLRGVKTDQLVLDVLTENIEDVDCEVRE